MPDRPLHESSPSDGSPPASADAELSFALVYDELRRLARAQLRLEQPGHTLDSVALVHEVYLRLHGRDDLAELPRAHFLALAARAMRRVLVDHARARAAAKRGAAARPLPLEDPLVLRAASQEAPERLLALDEAMRGLESVDPEASRAVELRYFAGLSHDEVAEALGVSVATARRRWSFAKAWLQRALDAGVA